MNVGIIIPYYNEWSLVHTRLMEISKYVEYKCNIILIDDASKEDTTKFVDWWMDNLKQHTLIYARNNENFGFGASMNYGVEIAKYIGCDIVILLSNDVIIEYDFVKDIIDKLTVSPNALIGGQIIDYPAGWNEFDIGGKNIVIPYLNGWLLACTIDTWNNLGGFDIRYGKFDYEDVDLSYNAALKNHQLIPLNSPKLIHIGGKTVSKYYSDRYNITLNNRHLFYEKWKDDLLDKIRNN